MELLSLDDPVFVVDLTPRSLEGCRANFDREGEADLLTPALPAPPDHPIRAMGLVFDWRQDPVLIPIPLTRDVWMLDAAARLIRTAVITGVPVASLATEVGDDELCQLYESRRLPAFLYDGLPAALERRVPDPALFRKIFGIRPP